MLTDLQRQKSGRHQIKLWRPLYDYVNILLALDLTMSFGMYLFLALLLPIHKDIPVFISAILNLAYGNNCQGMP